MTTTPHPTVRLALQAIVAVSVLLGGTAFAEHNTRCNGRPPETHAQLSADDENTPSRLQLTRNISNRADIDLDVCSADVTITTGNDGVFKVMVDIARPSDRPAGAYLETLDVRASDVTLQLELPRSLRAKVTVEIPASTFDLQVNLGRGDMILALGRVSGGDYKANVGYGHVDYRGDDDAYESLHINVGLGSLHDRRRNGESHHLIVSHSFEGTGKASVEINVGMGSVDLNPGKDHI